MGFSNYGNIKEIQMSLVIRSMSLEAKPAMPDFATGTTEQLYEMLQAHYAGTINIHDYWHVGDTRIVHLDAMAATGVGESHAAQDVEIVLMNAGGMTDISGTECAFVWGMKNCLNELGYMNSSNNNSGGWRSSARANWCENVLYPAFGSDFNRLFREFEHTSCWGIYVTVEVSKIGHCALFSEKMVFGDVSYTGEVENSHLYLQWYQTESNRLKYRDGLTDAWWLSSPYTGNTESFVCVDADGSRHSAGASNALGLSAFGLF